MDIIGSENVLIHFSYKWDLNSLLSTRVSFIGHLQRQEKFKAHCCNVRMEHANYYYIVYDTDFNSSVQNYTFPDCIEKSR